MIGDMLEGRTREGPVLIIGWYQVNGKVFFVCIGADGTPAAVELEKLSIDWHHDAQKGWQRDFEDEGGEG